MLPDRPGTAARRFRPPSAVGAHRALEEDRRRIVRRARRRRSRSARRARRPAPVPTAPSARSVTLDILSVMRLSPIPFPVPGGALRPPPLPVRPPRPASVRPDGPPPLGAPPVLPHRIIRHRDGAAEHLGRVAWYVSVVGGGISGVYTEGGGFESRTAGFPSYLPARSLSPSARWRAVQEFVYRRSLDLWHRGTAAAPGAPSCVRRRPLRPLPLPLPFPFR